jgi:hypothetical protein
VTAASGPIGRGEQQNGAADVSLETRGESKNVHLVTNADQNGDSCAEYECRDRALCRQRAPRVAGPGVVRILGLHVLVELDQPVRPLLAGVRPDQAG